MYECSQYVFKKIDPLSYMRLNYVELDSYHEAHLYMQKGDVVKINGDYFKYSGPHSYLSSTQKPSTIVFKYRKQIIYSFSY